MSRQIYAVCLKCLFSLVLLLSLPMPALAQSSSSAAVNGTVQDTTDARIPNATVKLVSTTTGLESHTTTSKDGNFTLPIVKPGQYTLQIERDGFDTTQLTGIVLNVGDNRSVVIHMKVGSNNETVQVDGSGLTLNTTDASVSTVVDRKFVENIPLNGRSFQDLISMTPGVVTQSPQNGGSLQAQGDFSVNGQRTESNYYMVDGVSGNIAAGSANGTGGVGQTGSISASSALGTTQNLISVDALQEFRVSSSSYSAEYGRTPGGQFSFSSRSGTNNPHGTVFDYLRNDLFDANDWFNDYFGSKKPALRQNDFGGTIGGPIVIPHLYDGRARGFFFFSYEGLRLVQPTNASEQYVPSLSLRQEPTLNSSISAILNAFPLPTGDEILSAGVPSGLSPFVKAFSLPSKIDATSIRVDQVISNKITSFLRYSYSPTNVSERTFSSIGQTQENTETYTAGLDYAYSPRISDTLRVGFAASRSVGFFTQDSFGGAVPVNLQSAIGVPGAPSTYTYFPYLSFDVGYTFLEPSKSVNSLRQWNITDTANISLGRHQLRFGIDERHLTSPLVPPTVAVYPYYYSRSSVETNQADYLSIRVSDTSRPTFIEFSAFVQDQWQMTPKISVSSGLRWEINPPPGAADGRLPYTVLGNISNPASLTLAPRGTPLWHTTWYNVAPRLGVAWKAVDTPHKETVVRAGGGVFFDTGNQAGAYGFSGLGFLASSSPANTSLPIPTSDFNISTAASAPYTDSFVYAYPQHMQLPYTLQWNLSLDQTLGKTQALTISYVGSQGRRLLQEQYRSVSSFNPSFGYIYYFPSGITSNYEALQVKFQRTISNGLQALASYTWSHALDFGSTDASLPTTYGNADFDVRHNLQTALSWDIPHVNHEALLDALVNGWGIDGRLNLRTAFPITLTGNNLVDPTGSESHGNVNYDASKPIYLYGRQYPGGRMLNGGPTVSPKTAAFSLPAGTGAGNAPRNFVRGFGANQINTAIRRDFPIRGDIRLLFRAEAFNVLNQPNFGYVDPVLTHLTFGHATKMLNASLPSVSSLYQQGGARSIQLSLKLAF